MILCAQNQMALMNIIYGEFDGDEFGAHLLSMDFNGDGYDDLLVRANKWNETGVYNHEYYPGKIYFYWGGPNFDNVPDFVLEGQWQKHYGIDEYATANFCNAGDMNGDGIEDLALLIHRYDPPWGGPRSVYFFLGGPNPHIEPDYIFDEPQEGLWIFPLGDIDGNELTELAISGFRTTVTNRTTFCYIWNYLYDAPVLFRINDWHHLYFLSGVGDVNNDGFDDAYLTMGRDSLYSQEYRAVLFFGDAISPYADSLVISESGIGAWPIASPLGDINGDGFADFIGYPDMNYHFIWFGSGNMDINPDLSLSHHSNDYVMNSFLRGSSGYAVFGDLNNDGYDDFVCSDNGANSYNGQAGIWLGGQNVNATVDLVLNPPTNWQWRNFGYAKAIGDFDGDGYDDLALSCPWWRTQSLYYTGRIYIYAGNAQLQDTTVSVDDPVSPPFNTDLWSLQVYPNPCPKDAGEIAVKLLGKGFDRKGIYSYKLFNLRGQVIKEGSVSAESLNRKQFNITHSRLNTGIYQIAVFMDTKIVCSSKVVIY